MPSSVTRIFIAGDFCSKPSTSVISVSEDLRQLIQSCDVRIINFEVPLKPDGAFGKQERERFWQNDNAPAFLKELGFNIFPLANNHAFDWGEAGFQKTKEALGDAAFGAGLYEDACQVKVVEVNGIRIGFLAVCFAAYTGVFNDTRDHHGMGCLYINDPKVNHLILEAKETTDFLFVLPHDGIEYIDIPMPETISRYRDFIDYGADGVIGTHPHCPQGWESYKGKPIFYSLGNFLFNSKDGYDYRATNRPHWYEGLCVVLTITDGKVGWEVYNTRNIGNTSVSFDFEPARLEHNNRICDYLHNEEDYNRYLRQVCASLGEKELAIIDKTFHQESLKDCTKRLFRFWINKIRGKNQSNDYSLLRLLTHDERRHLLMWTIKMKNRF